MRDLFLQANRAIQAGEIDRSTPNRVVSFDALQSYINYTFGECLSEERVEEEKTRLDWQRGRCPPEWTNEVFGAHLNMGVIPNLDRITQPVVCRGFPCLPCLPICKLKWLRPRGSCWSEAA